MKKINLAILFLFLITACSPDTFLLNKNSSFADSRVIFGFKMNELDSVEVTGENSLALHKGAIVGLALDNITQLHCDITCELTQGTFIRFATRTIGAEYEKQKGITFDYSTANSVISYNGEVIRTVDSIKAELNKPSRIHILNDGNLLNVIVNCDTVFYGKVFIPATEYLIVETPNNSTAKLSGIIFSSLRESDNKKVD